MKHGIAVAIMFVLAAGCADKQQVRLTVVSDPVGGKLYRQNGELLGPCPKVMRYDLNAEALKKGYVEAEGMIVRWPDGPERRSDERIRIEVDQTNRHIVFLQPEDKQEVISAIARIQESKKPEEKQLDWQDMKKQQSANTDLIRKELARSSLKPAVPNKPPALRPRRTLTLSQKQLALLDWNSSNSRGATVRAKRPLGGPGLEFEIHFPSNNPGSCTLSYVSSGTGGRGSLVGTDIAGYEEFALKLTLVSINGQSQPEMKHELVAGAVIGPTAEGRRTGYEPVRLGMATSKNTVVARTSVSADEVYEIGFHVHVPNYQVWDPSGSTIVLRVEQVEEGQTAPFDSKR